MKNIKRGFPENIIEEQQCLRKRSIFKSIGKDKLTLPTMLSREKRIAKSLGKLTRKESRK